MKTKAFFPGVGRSRLGAGVIFQRFSFFPSMCSLFNYIITYFNLILFYYIFRRRSVLLAVEYIVGEYIFSVCLFIFYL